MSADSVAAFRKGGLGPDLQKLAEQHMQHDLQPSDREALEKAARTVSTHATVGSLCGIALGVYLAYRIRANRAQLFNAFRASEQPTAIQFASGRTEPLPDITPMLKPSTVGDVATYTLLGAGGLFFGGETGLMTGTLRARSVINRDRESRERIQNAFRKFRADVLRREADALDAGTQREGGSTWAL